MNQSLSLYALEERYLALTDTEAMVSPEQEQEFVAELSVALKSAVEKRDRVAQFLLGCEHHISAIDTEIKRLQSLKKSWQCGYERMERYVVGVFKLFGEKDSKGKYKPLKGEVSTLHVRQNPPHVEIEDEAVIPIEYKTVTVTMPAVLWHDLTKSVEFNGDVKVQYSISKKLVKEAIDHGVNVPGADLAWGDFSLQVK